MYWEAPDRPHHETHVFSFVAQRTNAGIRSASDRDWSKVGVKIRRHDMRHTAGMRMMRETGDIKATSEFLGHSGVAITEHFYLDADTTRQREAMERRNKGVRRRREELERIETPQQEPASSGAAAELQGPHIAPHTRIQRPRKPS
jgi:integrase